MPGWSETSIKRAAAAVVLACTASTATEVAAAASCRVASADRTVALFELYTSEGCDSCPAADRWLARNVPAGSAGDAIALAFHVDYWDRLGWKDRFASPAYTERQHEAMRVTGGRFVYTPQLLLGGRDFAVWRSGSPARAVRAINARPARARIALAANVDGERVGVDAQASVDAGAGARRPRLAIALVDSGLVSDVEAGENKGARLSHDHVVRRFASGVALHGGAARAALEWTLPSEAGHSPAIVAFVQDAADGDVLQALRLPLAACAGTK